jgi:hypothetical protein
MGAWFYPMPCEDFILKNFIKMTFINIYFIKKNNNIFTEDAVIHGGGDHFRW